MMEAAEHVSAGIWYEGNQTDVDGISLIVGSRCLPGAPNTIGVGSNACCCCIEQLKDMVLFYLLAGMQ